ncbi:tether containing UBX domain for GLUT4-like [Ylistrum balloti]|uniref:tether containing UBX domain for GLUT4-like n=1 Tax=Ylistrum balloti TaxID=509963 RepID=UPI00290599F3|nr:tether containing UBX domain for GLUT4-like [Ylistrum balloti]
MATVQVLCPNGRRQNVKTTPNMKLLQVLEDVCQKQGFMPPDDYGFIHGNSKKQLDLSLSMRYANLANNAKLELVKSQTSRAIQDVTIALQLENGTRLQGKFPPQTSLWDILVHWEEKPDSTCKGELTKVDMSHDPPIQPVCIYMREEVIGEMALIATNLRKLGLTSGNAVIRLTHRAVEKTTMTDIANQLEKEKSKKARLEQMTSKQASEPEKQASNMSELSKNVSNPGIQNINKDNIDIETSKCGSGASLSKMDTSCGVTKDSPEPMEIEQNSSKSSVSTETSAMEVELGATGGEYDRIRSKTENNRQEEVLVGQSSASGVHMATSGVQSSSGSSRRGQSASGSKSAIDSLREMNIPGVEIFTPQDFQNLSPDEQRIARRLAAEYAKRNNQQVSQAPASFADFKFPEETKGKDLYHNELSSVTKEDFQPCDRETVLFNAEEPIRSPGMQSSQEISDEFFEVTEKDLRKMMTDLQKQTESDQMLMTQSMRELKQEEKYSKYQKVVIRVQFPDKLVVQGLFRPKETVFQIHKFVKSLLEDQKTPFYLYTSPPKCVLKDQAKTLILANLVPATLIYFGSEVPKEHYLSAKLMEGMESRKAADEKLNTCLPISAESQALAPVSGPSRASAGTSGGASAGAAQDRPRPKQTTQPSTGKEPGVPKWFKAGKK